MKIIPATKEQVAPGFHIRRALPLYYYHSIGPFLLLDQMGPRTLAPGEGQGIPPHPHRGFETITYMIEGKVEHHDSLGNKGVVGPGEVQWMTAASGIIHAEYIAPDFKEKGGKLHGFQIWVNLPAKDKMIRPSYQQFGKEEFPAVHRNDAEIRVIAGTYENITGPVKTRTPLSVYHVFLKAGGMVDLSFQESFETGIYIADGSVNIENNTHQNGMMVFMEKDKKVLIQATEDAHLLVLSGEPIREPVATFGPFVMNTQDEIREAILDYQSGKFGVLEG
ncbi:MAG: pirin family protein [Bacteroidia bacterium]